MVIDLKGGKVYVRSEEEIVLITDGGYAGQDNFALAKEKNIKLITTALIGKEAPDALADFTFSGSQFQEALWFSKGLG